MANTIFNSVYYQQSFWRKVYIKMGEHGEHEADKALKIYTQMMIRNTSNCFSFWSQCFFEDFNQFYNLDKAIGYADKSLVLYKERF